MQKLIKTITTEPTVKSALSNEGWTSYILHQNNSGGYFSPPACTIIAEVHETQSLQDVVERAFDMDYNYCTCCGERWCYDFETEETIENFIKIRNNSSSSLSSFGNRGIPECVFLDRMGRKTFYDWIDIETESCDTLIAGLRYLVKSNAGTFIGEYIGPHSSDHDDHRFIFLRGSIYLPASHHIVRPGETLPVSRYQMKYFLVTDDTI